jgi:hypothetical protein
MKIGDRIKDNDPRMPNRVLIITAIGVRTAHGIESVRAKSPYHKQEFRISAKRIHTDGKPRRGGFDLLKGDPRE